MLRSDTRPIGETVVRETAAVSGTRGFQNDTLVNLCTSYEESKTASDSWPCA